MITETEKDWPFPWDKSKGIYDSDGPKKPTRVEIDQVWYFVSPTGDSGVDTGRDRQFTACLTCNEILHHNTTAPSSRILHHHKNEHKAELELQPCILRRLIDGQVCGVLIRRVDDHNVESDGKRHWHSTGNQDVDDVAVFEAAKLRAVGRKVKIVVSTDGKSIEALDDGPDEDAPLLQPCDSGIGSIEKCGVPVRNIKGIGAIRYAAPAMILTVEADGEPHTCKLPPEEPHSDMPAVGDTVEVHFDSDGEDVGICPVVATAVQNFCVCIGDGKFPTEGTVDGDELMTLWPSQINEKWYLVKPGPEPMRKKPLTDTQRVAYDEAVKRVVEATKAAAASITAAVDEVVGTAGSWVDLAGVWRHLESGERFNVTDDSNDGGFVTLYDGVGTPTEIKREELHDQYARVCSEKYGADVYCDRPAGHSGCHETTLPGGRRAIFKTQARKDGWLTGPNAYDENAPACGEKVEDGRCKLEDGHTGSHQAVLLEADSATFSNEAETPINPRIKGISFLMKFNMGPPRIVHMRALVAAADRLQIPAEADFNGVTVLAYPGDDPESLDKNLEAALEQKEKFAMADRKRN